MPSTVTSPPTTIVLSALAADTAGGPSPALLRLDAHATVLSRLADQCRHHGDVVVLARSADVEACRATVGVPVVGVDDTVAAVRWLAADAIDPHHEIVVLDASTVTLDLGIAMIADGAAAGNRLVIRPLDARGAPVRCARQRVVAAGSAGHRLQRASHRGGGALRIAASDRAMLGETSDALDQMPSARGDGVAASDVTAWLTVALVRAGVRVRPVPLPAGMVWHRVRDAADVAEAAAHLQSTDAEAVRLTGAVKAQDGFFTTFFVSPYSRFIARWAARRGWSPDQVTAVSMATGVAAAAAFAVGSRPAMVAGALLLQVAFMLDCVDGQLARYARLVTPLGAWLDSVFDRGKEYVAYAGLAIGGIRAGDDASLWVLAAAALALQTVRHTIDFGYGVHQDRALANAQHAPFTDGEEPEPGFWDRAATDPVGASPVRAGGIAARIVTALRHAERIAPVKWAKRIVPLPIGERFALISIVAAVASPRAVFVALLAWGGTAAAYTFGGRFVRSWT